MLDRFQISELMEAAVCSGIARYEALMEPHKDKLSKRESESYVRTLCTRMGLYLPRKEGNRYIVTSGGVILQRWIEEGYVKGERGKTLNSPITFSKARIIEIVNEKKVSHIMMLSKR